MASELSVGKIGIGLGEGAAQGLLHVEGADGADLIMHRTAANTDGTLGAIQFGNKNEDQYLATISAVQDGTIDSAKLLFQTEAAGTTDKLTRLSISSAGAVSVPGVLSAANDIHLNGTTGTGKSIIFVDSAAAKYSWQIGQNEIVDDSLTISPSTAAGNSTFTTPAITVSTAGLASFSSGIALGNTGTASAGTPSNPAQTLDFYEEGTWTPDFRDSSDTVATGVVTFTSNYTRIGVFVYVSGAIRTQGSSSVASLSGDLSIGGLPFANSGADGHAMFHTTPNTSSYNAPNVLPRTSAIVGSAIQLYKYEGTGGRTTRFQVSDLNMSGNSNYMLFTGVYKVA